MTVQSINCSGQVLHTVTVTELEQRVLQYHARGLSTQKIAVAIEGSKDAVRQHFAKMIHTLDSAGAGVSDRITLLIWILQHPEILTNRTVELRGRHTDNCRCNQIYCRAMWEARKPVQLAA